MLYRSEINYDKIEAESSSIDHRAYNEAMIKDIFGKSIVKDLSVTEVEEKYHGMDPFNEKIKLKLEAYVYDMETMNFIFSKLKSDYDNSDNIVRNIIKDIYEKLSK